MDCARHRAIYNSVRNDDFPLDDCLIAQYESTRLFTERDDITRNPAVHPQASTEVDVAVDVGTYSNQRINLTLGFLCFFRTLFLLYKDKFTVCISLACATPFSNTFTCILSTMASGGK